MQHETQIKKHGGVNWTWFLFSFKGRISRGSFWIFNLIVLIGGMVLGMFTEAYHDIREISRPEMMFMLWVLWPSLAVQAKRWHDIDKSALWLLINLIPIAGPLWALVQNGFMPGTRGPNRFGSDPLEEKTENDD